MKKYTSIVFCLGLACLISTGAVVRVDEEDAPLSESSQECIDCHRTITPGLVADWESGHHAHGIPAESMKKSRLEREVSSRDIPEELLNVGVGCFECHGRNTERHKDSFEHFGYKIHVVVSPEDCGVCHAEEKAQFETSKKAYAYDNLASNPVYHALVETVTSVKHISNGKVVAGSSSDVAKWESCYGCHGTKIEVSGLKTLDTVLDEIQVPDLKNWPSQGVGRINPDGSRGACTACHPRHSFSIEIARKPETCSQCHLEPDLPAWNVFRESKHGNIVFSKQQDWNWEAIPWTVGRDFTAPTCAVCHNALLVDPEGEVIAERSHDFGSRLWVRIFGLIYSHPQPKSGQTYLIKNEDGLPLPTTFNGSAAAEFLLDEDAQAERKDLMTGVCTGCHSSSWTANYFDKFTLTLKETDAMVKAATDLMGKAWEAGLEDQTNPFDESIEQKWLLQWLFYANSVRYASAMSGPDYAAFKNGWWYLTKNLKDMTKDIDIKSSLKK